MTFDVPEYFVTQHPDLLRIVVAFCASFLVALALAPQWIKILKQHKLKQFQRDQSEVRELATLHEYKSETPTMGGLFIVVSTVLSVLFLLRWNLIAILAITGYLLLAFVGFFDDYAKINKKNAKGISGKKKLLSQLLITCLVLGAACYDSGIYDIIANPWVPFLSTKWAIPGWILPVYIFFVLAGTSNSVNLTDGLDGLATGCALPVLLFFCIACYIYGSIDCWSIFTTPDIQELAVISAAVCGALLVFLWFNVHPAKVFMGDIGSLSLGMLIGLIALLSGFSLFLVIAGGVFVCEALSDILQVGSYKLRHGKRIFKMAPIHHHFELSGINEVTIVQRFWIVSLLLSIIAFIGLITLNTWQNLL